MEAEIPSNAPSIGVIVRFSDLARGRLTPVPVPQHAEVFMRLALMNAVILAEDYERMRDWYIDALELTLDGEWTEKYHYAELVRDGRFVVGIASAKEMGVEPVPKDARKHAAVVPQFNVDDCRAFLARIEAKGGEVPFGPTFEKDEGFWYGGFADPEGNPSWVVELPKQLPV